MVDKKRTEKPSAKKPKAEKPEVAEPKVGRQMEGKTTVVLVFIKSCPAEAPDEIKMPSEETVARAKALVPAVRRRRDFNFMFVGLQPTELVAGKLFADDMGLEFTTMADLCRYGSNESYQELQEKGVKAMHQINMHHFTSRVLVVADPLVVGAIEAYRQEVTDETGIQIIAKNLCQSGTEILVLDVDSQVRFTRSEE